MTGIVKEIRKEVLQKMNEKERKSDLIISSIREKKEGALNMIDVPDEFYQLQKEISDLRKLLRSI